MDLERRSTRQLTDIEKFKFIEVVLSGRRTPSEFIGVLLSELKRRNAQREFNYRSKFESGGLTRKFHEAREEVASYLRKGNTIRSTERDLRLISGLDLFAEASEFYHLPSEGIEEKSVARKGVQIRVAGLNLDIEDVKSNAEIGIELTEADHFRFFSKVSSREEGNGSTEQESPHYQLTGRMNSYDVNLASWIINTYKEACLLPQPNDAPIHRFAFGT